MTIIAGHQAALHARLSGVAYMLGQGTSVRNARAFSTCHEDKYWRSSINRDHLAMFSRKHAAMPVMHRGPAGLLVARIHRTDEKRVKLLSISTLGLDNILSIKVLYQNLIT